VEKKQGKKNEIIRLMDFYLRYFVGHKGRYGQEFLEFEVNSEGRLRYGNHSNYKNDGLIRREVFLNKLVLDEIRRIIEESEIMKQDDTDWPRPGPIGRQELEITLNSEKINFQTTKISSFAEVQESRDSQGMRILYYFIQDIKSLIFSLISLHFRVRPVN
jgi:protein mago nashi